MRSVIVVLIAALLVSCGDIYRYLSSGKVSWAIKREVRDYRATQVSIAKVAPFAWDEFFFFGPYHPTSLVCEKLGISPSDCNETIRKESTNGAEMLLVFRKGGQVVHSELHLRRHGDFTPTPQQQPFNRENALFSVVREEACQEDACWIKLVPVQGGRAQ